MVGELVGQSSADNGVILSELSNAPAGESESCTFYYKNYLKCETKDIVGCFCPYILVFILIFIHPFISKPLAVILMFITFPHTHYYNLSIIIHFLSRTYWRWYNVTFNLTNFTWYNFRLILVINYISIWTYKRSRGSDTKSREAALLTPCLFSFHMQRHRRTQPMRSTHVQSVAMEAPEERG